MVLVYASPILKLGIHKKPSNELKRKPQRVLFNTHLSYWSTQLSVDPTHHNFKQRVIKKLAYHSLSQYIVEMFSSLS